MRELKCTPDKAREMLSRAGIRTHSDFGRKLLTIIDEAESPDEEQSVTLTEREEAQMHLPFLLSRFNDFPEEKIAPLFESDYDLEVISNWPEEPLNDEDYNDIVDAIQEFDTEVTQFMLLDHEAAGEVLDSAAEKI